MVVVPLFLHFYPPFVQLTDLQRREKCGITHRLTNNLYIAHSYYLPRSFSLQTEPPPTDSRELSTDQNQIDMAKGAGSNLLISHLKNKMMCPDDSSFLTLCE